MSWAIPAVDHWRTPMGKCDGGSDCGGCGGIVDGSLVDRTDDDNTREWTADGGDNGLG